MKCQVIFMSVWNNCPDQIRDANDQIQAMINEQKALFMFETRDYNEYQRGLSKIRSHQLWRDRVHIVKDGCCKIHFPD